MSRNCLELPNNFRKLSAKNTRAFISTAYGNDRMIMYRSGVCTDLLKASKSVAKDVRDRSGNIGSLKGQGISLDPLVRGALAHELDDSFSFLRAGD